MSIGSRSSGEGAGRLREAQTSPPHKAEAVFALRQGVNCSMASSLVTRFTPQEPT